ncbi:CHAT domain-containing protein [Aetokthonos hydrillicola Thurmond2011]|jgi:hypothetical protein|uniref:CHAT domain-containing protein n=1 Tax=Aetokthonos hydrillicola Thurmond2011 TaxID=2712845 RepID=A0AAP5I1Y1_9CYAN|nr:CHAT domain-containing protein [Aetokthonos hydrillicola]MBO3462312.1 CHAT domain-containing protein [Aetokthonos hydrillicola CCALA 1050]MBW4590823.1 CHAT domain-containing protein [Aetokthonos hydrillicola CCALA 1050]MDR9893632.1 CHAT domain-containing protein [Aetokthonos hydrillicola Thurmond2011]
MIKILFLAADPSDASRLRLGQELRDIKERLRIAKAPENYQLEQRESVRVGDITQAIFDVQPNIVHFSGHGTDEGELCFENQVGEIQSVKPDALAAMFELFAQHVNCVVLNACYSEIQAQAIAEHIPFVIGMKDTIIDQAGVAFSLGFYKALAANRSIEDAYKFGCVEIRLNGYSEHLKPVLYPKKSQQSQLLDLPPRSQPSLTSNLNPQKRKRISQELDSLQQQYDLLTEKCSYLRMELVKQASASVKFQLQKEIEQTEAQIKQVAERINQLENSLQ